MNPLPLHTAFGLTILLTIGCGDGDNAASGGGGTGGTGTGGAGAGELRSLDNCQTNIADDVPEFYKTYFRCVDITMDGDTVVIQSLDLPPHPSAYYDPADPNYVAWDESSGNFQIPATLVAQDITVRITSDPVAKGLTIDASLLDGTLGTSGEEIAAGAAGIGLDSVAYFSGAAGMGMNIADEAATFDRYEAHHAMGTYHYHGQTPGPLEVLERAGIIDDSTPGSASVELYAIFCDGTLVLGCTELDGSALDTSGMDAQGGHVHDIDDGATTHFTDRYHTHVCPGIAADFSPEIQYYGACP
jgi:hypothetical protein